MKGRSLLNPFYWAYYFSITHGIDYCLEDQQFYQADPDRHYDYKRLDASFVKLCLLDFLMAAKDPRLNCVLQPSGNKLLDQLMATLKTVAIGQFPGTAEALERFLSECLEKQDHCGVTTKELYAAFEQFCGQRNYPILPVTAFQKRIPVILARIHGVSKSNSLEREDGAHAGYRGVRFKYALVDDGGKDGKGGKAVNIAQA